MELAAAGKAAVASTGASIISPATAAPMLDSNGRILGRLDASYSNEARYFCWN
ncbi:MULTISPECIES: hypothetical protein [unclassified Mesorhizobium]|uniref:hypothetical protein n=1 Tax=unclassified Mesorhizobium TaxID=325217 RepID=UPI0016732780|nr:MULTISPECIES: hypothetical protein [unclassified Mesorhizobium]